MKFKTLGCAIKFLLILLAAGLPLAARAQVQNGYWWNPSAPGSGFVIEIQNNQMFMAGFLYSSTGEATWVASSGAMTSASYYSGSLNTYTGGQTLTGAWKAATPTAPLGTISLTFIGNTEASLTWPGGTMNIQRFDFGPGGTTATQPEGTPQTGWWWNTAEGGRGFAVEIQGGTMYFAGYMYDSSGNPIWYLSTGSMVNSSMYQGTWQQYGNGQTLTGSFQPSSVVNADVGSVTLQFISPAAATMTLPNGRQIPLERFAFAISGPTLTAFAPASAAPAAPLVITGANIDVTTSLTLTLFDSLGYSATIPLSAASATSVQVAVPPYVSAATSAFGSGTVNIKLTQTTASAAVDSNVLSGFTIQPLPTVPGTAGQSTLALITASLQEAQKLKSSLGTSALASGTLITSIDNQINDIQTLVYDVQGVVNSGLSFTLGVVGGVNITVSQSNIADVDSLILATLTALANPGGAAEKQASAQAESPPCLSAEAQAYLTAMTSGTASSTQLTQLAQTMLEASGSSPACTASGAFNVAYQIFGGAGNMSLGLTNGAGGTTNPARLPGATLFATAFQGTNTAVALNALSSSSQTANVASLQQTIGGVNAFGAQSTNEILTKTATGPLKSSLNDSQTIISQVANPFQGTITGTWTGICNDGYYGTVDAGGTFTVTISTGGNVNGSFSGDASGPLTGIVNTSGGYATSGSGTIATWSGQFFGGAKLSGTGVWSGTDANSGNCSGTWSG